MLSVVISTWNEADNLPVAVRSVSGLADEIVVVDTGSSDDTVKVAAKLGCIVYRHKYTGIVEPVRNFSINKAKGDWILLLDADEEIPQALAREIKKVITSNPADYYRLPRKNIIFNSWITSSHWWPDYVYRLFKKGFVVWDEAIHSIPATRGRGEDFPADPDCAIIHHHYRSIAQYLERINRYTDYQLKTLQDKNIAFSWTLLVTEPAGEFIRQFFSRKGYKDGVHGLALAGLQSFSHLVLYLKLWQVSGFKEEAVPPDKFGRLITGQFRQLRWWIYEDRGWIYKIWRKIRMYWL
jgi:glycosyltransferase involved in cell wall biosynthesis